MMGMLSRSALVTPDAPPDWGLMGLLAEEATRIAQKNFQNAIAPWMSLPVQPLQDTVDPDQLADADSRFQWIDETVRLHYKKRSPSADAAAGASGPAPAVLCIHGFNGSTFSWRHMLEPLGETLHECAGAGAAVAFDRPPHGLSNRPLSWDGEANNPYTVAAGAKQGLALLDQLGLTGDVILIGHSAGAPVALELAALAPERVKGLVLIAPAVFLDSPLANASLSTYVNLAYTQAMLRIPGVNVNFIRGEILKMKAAVENSRQIGFFDKSLITDEVLYGYTKPIYAHDWDRGSLLQYQSFGLSTPSLLAGSSTPVLIVQGAQDQTVPASAALSLQRALGERAQLVQLERCGHLPMDECADRLNAVVLPFVARVMRRDDAAGPTQQLSVTEPVVVQRSPGQGVSK